MNKTPVSILQEMMVKQGTVPNYELIHDGGGTHINTFTYRVSCDGLVATGEGRCKKDAKHTAAKNMLERIASARSYPQLPATPADSPVRTPTPQSLPFMANDSSNKPFLNAIGELKDLCIVNELQDPDYKLISDVGPPHARIFTYQCIVSTFREEGRATTKKQAKHEASRKMLERLLEVVADLKDKDDCHSGEKENNCNHADSVNNVEQGKGRVEFGKLASKRLNLGVKLNDYDRKLKKSYGDDTVPSRSEIVAVLDWILDVVEKHETGCSVDALAEITLEFKKVLAPFNTDISTFTYHNAVNDEKVIFVKFNTTPDIVEAVTGNDVVLMELKAISKAVRTFKMLLA